MNYQHFLSSKKIREIATGHDISLAAINPNLFDFQKVLVRWAVGRGRAAIFADTGLGKTFMECEWSRLVVDQTGRPVIIVAPLSVALQTVREAAKFGIEVSYHRSQPKNPSGIIITNYEMLDRFDLSLFVGLVLDESSILKSHDGKTRSAILEASKLVPYRLSCTATPSPNDFMELGNQAEFVGVMSREEMLAMFFTHDGGDTTKWRLKGHGEVKFWEWLSTWAVVIRMPSDIGFDDGAYDLPPLVIHEHIIETEKAAEGQLFYKPAMGLSEQRAAKRESMDERVSSVASLVNNSSDPWLVWCHLNAESEALGKLIPSAVTVSGSDSIEHKESAMEGFTTGDHRDLISKPSLCGFGMNWQHCYNMAFAGLDNSFESMYQAIRRCYRFGQTKPVNVHIFLSQAELPILENIKRKEQQHNEMSARMVEHMKEFMQRSVFGMTADKSEYRRDLATGKDWTIHLGDCVEVASELESDSIGFSVFSPPFASLYTYSNSDRDMGNCKTKEQFMEHFGYLVEELHRVTMPGRLCSVHCMNLPTSKQHHGYIGIDDFRGDIIRLFRAHGWIYHSEVCIWKDPVTAMQRTKALGLLHKTIRKDSSMSRQGVPDYLVTFRKPGVNSDPIRHYRDEDEVLEVCEKELLDYAEEEQKIFPVELWQRYASPVWFDINPTRTLQYQSARENEDERHICPLQLDVIERAMELWSKPGDLVFSPFTGIGSEGYTAVKMGRRFVGAELKRSYFNLAVKNMKSIAQQDSLFAFEQEEAIA
ncbi:DNA methyltransferase [Nitrosovibrio sp. Nv4]|uniref:DNA methyltransferase n=1 Tax=Nitrosovibrio sp. Nv4 TaxID=1945880 RepID=UPI000BCB2BAF|nr:DNA methyltransferase [Nitrosovibrio sp. Nv4]SOD42401.1 DNA modification methylase [Nitrosovibrio sp. Nv4]